MSLFDTLHSDRKSQLGNGRKVGVLGRLNYIEERERKKPKQREETENNVRRMER